MSSPLETILSISSISGDFGFLLCMSRCSFLCTCDGVLHTNPESCLLVQCPQLDCEAWRYFSLGRIGSYSPSSIHHIKSPGLTSLELQWVSFPIARGNSSSLLSKAKSSAYIQLDLMPWCYPSTRDQSGQLNTILSGSAHSPDLTVFTGIEPAPTSWTKRLHYSRVIGWRDQKGLMSPKYVLVFVERWTLGSMGSTFRTLCHLILTKTL